MSLKEKFAVKVQDGFNGFDIGATAEECADICVEVSTDFLEWYISEGIDPYNEPRSIYDLWWDFSIEKQL